MISGDKQQNNVAISTSPTILKNTPRLVAFLSILVTLKAAKTWNRNTSSKLAPIVPTVSTNAFHSSSHIIMWFLMTSHWPLLRQGAQRTGSECFALLGRGFVQIFGQIVSVGVTTLINTNVVASSLIKREKALLPVAICHSKTPLNFICGNENVTHSAQ